MKALHLILALTFLAPSLEITAQFFGCTDSEACNYVPSAQSDNGTCTDEPVWFIPGTATDAFGSSPAVLACGAPDYYVLAVQSCVISIIESDTYCIDFTWDSVCQNAYESCVESVTACTTEEACNYDPNALINDYSCVYEPVWYIPQIPTAFNGSSPAILSCGLVEGYVLADQCCVSAIVVSDDYCIDITWDQTCQDAYNECLETGNVFGCADPEACNYVECVNLSDGSCNYEQWYIPNALGSSPVVLSCSALAGFTLANQCAIGNLISNDPYCVNNNYDFTCQSNYDLLLSNIGCTDLVACNYDFFASCDQDQCDYSCLGCTNSDACNYDPFATHVENYCDYFSCENEEDFFITKWQTVQQNDLIEIRPNIDFIDNYSSFTLDYFVDWGDGTFSNHITGVAGHYYETPNVYEISIRGVIPAVRLAPENGEELKILEVLQWGNNNWESMSSAFRNCVNLDVTASDTPDLSQVTACNAMFVQCQNLTHGLSNWDVSNVTNMRFMFSSATNFNEDISSWNVSNVTSIGDMFAYVNSFNQDISSWDVGNVVYMDRMFFGAHNFNQNIGSWNVSNVISMHDMFSHATNFNQDIGSWDVSNVTNMRGMFASAFIFNQDIGAWNVSNVTTMEFMFYSAYDFNQNIGSWNVSNAQNMRSMFTNAFGFNQNINSWNVSNVTTMSLMFENALNFNQNIGSWDVSNVTSMSEMFSSADVFNQDISTWDVSNVQYMSNMFSWAENFNQDIGSWDVSNVGYMDNMFNNAESFNQDLSSWDVSNVTSMGYMFAYTDNFNQNLTSWDISSVTYIRSMFLNAQSFNQDLSEWDFSNVTIIGGFLDISGMSTENYDLLLESLANQAASLTPNLELGAEGINYCGSEEARAVLTNAPLNWLITDAGLLCTPECVGDLNSDGAISSQDLSLFLAAYGTIGDSPADFNGDGTVGVQDLTIFLSVFGTDCF